jgi:hypothetical protein
LARYNRDIVAQSDVPPQPTWSRRPPAPRPGPHSGEFPEDAYADPTMQDEYADWFSAEVVPRVDSGGLVPGELGPRERAAYELMSKIDALLQRLDRANPDKGEDITL